MQEGTAELGIAFTAVQAVDDTLLHGEFSLMLFTAARAAYNWTGTQGLQLRQFTAGQADQNSCQH